VDTQGKRVLVVDRDLENLTLAEARLSARGYIVSACRTSLDAVRELERQLFDLVLVSVGMELVDGQELTERIRKATFTCYVPIIMMAGGEDLAELIHGMDLGFDDFLIKPFDPLTLQLRVMMNIGRSELRMQANPLTKLPGNIAIEKVLKERIASDMHYSVCYIDINHFKSFNDVYGFEKGDAVLQQMARIIVDAVRKSGASEPFVGHVGGDDFIVVLHPDHEAPFAKECIKEFDRIIPAYYTEDDRRRGHVTVRNRKGRIERFPLMSVAVAAVTNLQRKFVNPGEIAQVAAEVKKFLKTQTGSIYLRDRREKQFERLEDALEALSRLGEDAQSRPSVEPLGQFFLAAGLITEDELQEALKTHLNTGKRLGEVLIAMNLVRSYDVGKMLEKKLGVPYAPLRDRVITREVARLFTASYVKAHRVLPIGVADGSLDVAMLDPFDLKVLDEIERNTGRRVMPYLALEEEFEEFYEQNYRNADALE
jgi:diguanylate cyclase (GGDEF)-like protein